MRKVSAEGRTQNEIIYAHLKANPTEGITPMEAFGYYGITRLGGRIFELRKLGIGIESTMETKKVGGHARNYARYTLAS